MRKNYAAKRLKKSVRFYLTTIHLTKTYPYLGGKRFWFLCPDCNRRVRKLYRPENKFYFRCRICYDLMYQSQESNVYDSWLKRTISIDKIDSANS